MNSPNREGQSFTSTSLLDGIRSHDSETWQRFVDAYGPMIYWASRRAGLEAADAADVTQDVFGAVAQSIDRFRRDRPGDSFRAWLWTILRNKIRDHFRRNDYRNRAEGGTVAHVKMAQIPEPPDPDDVGSSTGSGAVLLKQTLQLVRAEFESNTWDAFWQTAVEGQKPADVARDLGMTLHAVYKAKSRVLCRLRQEYDALAQ